ncbi:hypothetical protein LTR50_003480 [Elasticomyces elasticus]|nr:hypothetical protein LTR50_003480 [Elasticomyces elasticus]
MLVPEVVLFCAWEQWWAARQLRDNVNVLRQARRTREDGADECGEFWSMKQAFFAVSGGFAVDSTSFWKHDQLMFSPVAIMELAKLDLLPRIPEETVEEKSRADATTKALVCLQAGWFFVQSIARLAQHLPLTLLEIHTMAHVACAFCMYLFWLEKPYDVRSPILLENELAVDMAALFVLDHKTRFACCSSLDIESPEAFTVNYDKVRAAHIHAVDHGITGYLRCKAQGAVDWKQECSHAAWHEKFPLSISKLDTNSPIHEHMRRANNALTYIYGLPRASDGTDEEQSGRDASRSVRQRYCKGHVVPVRSNFRIDGSPFGKTIAPREAILSLQLKVFAILCTLYGGAHLSAWNAHFPSFAEMWLWRVSGIGMVSMPAVFVVHLALVDLEKAMTDRKNVGNKVRWQHLRKGLGWVCGVLNFAVVSVLGFVLIACYYGRVFVLVESFASLRSPSDGTYVTVSWPGVIPHVG